MQRSNKILLEQNLKKFLLKSGYDPELTNYKFVLKVDNSDTKELTGNMEQIINFVVLPKKVNQLLFSEDIMEILVSGKNDIPIWIGVEVISKQIQLTISRRYKKLKVVEQWHSNNETIPFLKRKELKSTNLTKEFHFAYPAGMFENQLIECEELDEIVNILNLGKPNFKKIQDLIWENVENPQANIIKLISKDSEDQYALIDLWNCDQINVLNCYFKTVGANGDFIRRSLNRWNNRLWKDLGPKVKEIENIEEQEFVKGRNIVKFETKNAV